MLKSQSKSGICRVLFLKQAMAYQFISKLSIFKANCYLFCLFMFSLFACSYFSRNEAQSSKQQAAFSVLKRKKQNENEAYLSRRHAITQLPKWRREIRSAISLLVFYMDYESTRSLTTQVTSRAR